MIVISMKRVVLLGLVICGLGILTAVWAAKTRKVPTQSLPRGALRGMNVLLITVDTLRADHVGAYGYRAGTTPVIDGLAHDGLRFERTYAHVPMTLPSHTSLLTARYPTRTGVRDNGVFRLGADTPTLATSLKAAGYRTAAFVGAFVLDARFGLNRGFDVYDDRMRAADIEEVAERRAEDVLNPAFQWINNRQLPIGDRPLPWFAWIHLYDPHEPYAPPEPYRSRYAAAPYDGEIAYADAALGAFLDRLRGAGALANTLIVVASDHGESLGEHGERTHGLFAYDATLRVPLVMWAPSRIRPAIVQETVRLVDVAPTVLDLAAAPPLSAADGRSIRPFASGERPYDDPGSYFEALNANFTRDWAPLIGVIRRGFKLIELPAPELYDLARDPSEAHNIYAREPATARELEALLDRIVPAGGSMAAAAPLDPDAEARLRSLGYVARAPSAPTRRYTSGDDPKQLVHLNNALDDAAARWARGDRAAAIDLLQSVIRERPSMTLAYDRLAFMLRASGRIEEAVQLLDEAARAGRADRTLMRTLGGLLRDAGQLERSAAILEPLTKDDADLQSADALGQTYARMGRTRAAEALFRRVVAASPNAATTWNNLGSLQLITKRPDEAADAFSRAIAINPESVNAHNGLGVALAMSGDLDRAAAEWRRVLELRPDFVDARENLRKIGR